MFFFNAGLSITVKEPVWHKMLIRRRGYVHIWSGFTRKVFGPSGNFYEVKYNLKKPIEEKKTYYCPHINICMFL